MELKLKNSVANEANLIQLSVVFHFAYYLSVTTVHLKALREEEVEFQALGVMTLGVQAYFLA